METTMIRCRRPLGAALSALLVLALTQPALGQDQPLPSDEPPPPPAPKVRPKPVAKPAPRKAAPKAAPRQAPAEPAERPDDGAEQGGGEPAEARTEEAPAEQEGTGPAEAEEEPAAEPVDEEAEPAMTRAEPAAAAPAAVPTAEAEPVSTDAAVVVSYGPRVLDYEEGDHIPDGYVKDRRMRTPLVVGGAVTLGLTWLASCGAAAYFIWNDRRDQEPLVDGFNDIPGEAALAIPLAGPFVAIDTVNPNPAGMALLVADGVIQLGALTMLITGLAAKETVLVRTEVTDIALLPSAGPSQGGMSLSGTF